MQSKQDQLQAHLYVLGRVVSALTRGEPDAAETPMRRFTGASFGGSVLAGVLVAGAAVLGLVLPSSGTAWRAPGTLVVEKETGTRYLLVDGVLHPVLNYASARLLVGSQLHVEYVAAKTIGAVPRGVPLGIPGAPDALPQPGWPGGRDWALCADPAVGEASASVRTVVALGSARPIPTPLDEGALLVQGPDGRLYLAQHDQRMLVPDRAALVVLGYGSSQPWRVSAPWLAALPTGPDLRAPEVPGRGADGPRVGGQPTKAGQVLAVSTGTGGGTGTSYFLVLQDGLAPLSALEATLLIGEPATRGAYPGGRVAAVPVNSSDAAAVPLSATKVAVGGLPTVIPALVEPVDGRPQAPCVRVGLAADGSVATVRLGLTDSVTTDGSQAAANRALLPPGGGLLAQVRAAPGVQGGKEYLVTDLGAKYPLGADAAAALGFSENSPTTVPSNLLDLLPTGPALDQGNAAQEQPVTAPSADR
ncbi:type VII secretion protein EccB [Kitasatospora sp. NPDC059571]|uniref:type VII secretion protein EccB n=1 Tax=Kitasatospora sp. NPDC059571 TaxID=3346871 RepID=UPI0036C67497